MNIILIGFKSCGKTTIGKKLAKINQKKFIDTDTIIQEKYKREYGSQLSIIEIYKHLGESKFRNIENEAVAGLVLLNNTIIATGGGAILNPDNLILLKRIGCLVFLDVSLTAAINRIYKDKILDNLFLGTKKSIKNITHIFKSRLNIYRSAADFSVKVDNLTEEMIVNEIIMYLK